MNAHEAHFEEIRDDIADVVREAYRNDWARWELPGIARSTAARRGLTLTDAETAEIVGEVVPRAVV